VAVFIPYLLKVETGSGYLGNCNWVQYMVPKTGNSANHYS